jgi:hypothetical protein
MNTPTHLATGRVRWTAAPEPRRTYARPHRQDEETKDLFGQTIQTRRQAEQESARLALLSPEEEISITFRVRRKHGPALRAAIDDIRERVGERSETIASYATEQAVTDAAIALGSLAAAVNRHFPLASEAY